MSTCPRTPAWAAAIALVFGACFSPTGQSTEASSDASAPTGTDAVDPTTALTDPPTTGTTSEPTSSSSSGGDPTTGPCSSCDPPTPYCAGDGCIGCQDLAALGMSCAGIDPDRPHCDAGGECVGCTLDEQCEQSLQCHPALKTCVACVIDSECGGPLTCVDGQCAGCVESIQCPFTQPVCDGEAGTCRRCREHSECPESACELDLGTCFPPGETRHRYVDPGQPCADSDCPSDTPCCTAYQAVDKAAADAGTYHVIHVKAGLQDAPVRLMVPGKRLAFLGEPGVVFSAESVDSMFVLGDVVDLQTIDSKLFVSQVQVTDSPTTSVVICMSAAQLWLDDVEIAGSTGNALLTTNCALTARRSTFRGSSAGVTSGAGGVARFENSIFGDMIAGAPLQIINGGTLDLLYTTVVDKGNIGQGVLKCFTDAPVTIRNSILVGVGSEIQCAPGGPSISNTVTTVVGWPGVGLTEVTIDNAPGLFVDHPGGDYHLGTGAARLATSAVRQATDPDTDIDGQPRPAGDGVADFAGADRP